MATELARIWRNWQDLDQPLAEDEQTPITCLACDGDYDPARREGVTSYQSRPCRHCIRGSMTPALRRRWRSGQSGIRVKP